MSTPRWFGSLVVGFVVFSLVAVTGLTLWVLYANRESPPPTVTLAQPVPSLPPPLATLHSPTPTTTATETRTPIGTPTSAPTASHTPTPRLTNTRPAVGDEANPATATPTTGFFITVPRPATFTATATPTETPARPANFPYRFDVQAGSPIYSRYPGGCNWMGFTGQVFDLTGQPLYGLVVRISGPEYLLLSGNARAYGFAGWLERVAAQPASTNGFYSIQLQDALGNALSPAVPVATFADCARNLITVNFVQVAP